MHKYSAILAAFICLSACRAPEKKELPDFLSENIDTAIRPADDFFAYANGAWVKKNPIPADQSRWTIGSLVQLDIYNRLRVINEKALSENDSAGSLSAKIGNFWFSGMDSAGIEKAGLSPLQPQFDQIQKIKTVADFLQVAAILGKTGTDVLMGYGAEQDEKKSDQMALYIGQGGIGLPNREYYFNTDKRTVEVRNAYRKYLYTSFRTLGRDSLAAMSSANAVFDFETKLAGVSRKMEALRDPESNYHKMAFASLQKKYNNINWTDFLKDSDIPMVDSVIVGQPEFLSGLNQELKKTSISVLKDYLSFHLLDGAAPYLNEKVFMDRFSYSQTLSGVQTPKPRWKRVLDSEEKAIGEALGQLFVHEYFSEKSKQRYINLVEAMRDAYKERIMHLSWMSDSTKKQAIEKLSRLTRKVGYPDKWRDFSALLIDRGPFVLNVQRANAWWYNDNIKKLGKPVDRTEWDMTPQTYNAYYNPANNEIVLPAGQFMVPGKRDEDLDDAFVYGYAAASTIGHEMTHGFDDQGRKFDAAGNLHEWWQPGDAGKYNANAARIIRQFNEFVPVDTLHINGENTQGENIADLGGLVIGWDAFVKSDAYKKGELIGGLTPAQRYFLGYAYSWASAIRNEQLAHQILTNVHAPARERVNGPLANLPAFYEAFGIKSGDKMYRADSLRVSIW